MIHVWVQQKPVSLHLLEYFVKKHPQMLLTDFTEEYFKHVNLCMNQPVTLKINNSECSTCFHQPSPISCIIGMLTLFMANMVIVGLINVRAKYYVLYTLK